MEPVSTTYTDPEKLEEYFGEFMEKYCSLVWYARSRPRADMEASGTPESIIQGALNSQSKVEEAYVDEINELRSDSGDWSHGFNSGALATMRYVMTAMRNETYLDEESDNLNDTFTVGGIEDAKEEFPMLDT